MGVAATFIVLQAAPGWGKAGGADRLCGHPADAAIAIGAAAIAVALPAGGEMLLLGEVAAGKGHEAIGGMRASAPRLRSSGMPTAGEYLVKYN
jgi:hypothetical protein